MIKVAIKNENITSVGGIYHIMDVFSKLGFEKLTESVLGKRGSSGKAFSHGSIFGSLFFSYLCHVRFLLTCYVCSTKIGEISDISKCFEDFVSQALGVLTRIYAAELRN